MTSATNARRGFTLLELLVVIGIIALLAGILLPAVTKIYGRSIQLRTQADLQAISTALEAYKSDFGGYPPVTSQNSGAAVLGKALLGPADAAHYYTGPASALVASTTLQNSATLNSYSSSTTYKAGDAVLTGAAPNYDTFANGTQATIFVCARNDTQADGTTHTPTNGDLWWSLFVPFDGNDGNGSRARLAAVPDAAGLPHAAAGKVYGPYLDVERFRTNGTAILDRYGSPILYFPLNKSASPTVVLPASTSAVASGGGLVALSTPVTPDYPPAINVRSQIYANDNLGPFVNETVMPVEGRATLLARIALTLGDYNTDGKNDPIAGGLIAVAEPAAPQVPFLLWTAGADMRFGPAGIANPPGWKRGDFYTNGTNTQQNQTTAAALDDVTNFR